MHENVTPSTASSVLIENSFTAEPSVAMDTIPKGRFRKFLHTFACARGSLHGSLLILKDVAACGGFHVRI